jgi:hypothetical protein
MLLHCAKALPIQINNPASAAIPAGQNNPIAQAALLDNFDQLNEEGQTKALDYVEDLVLTGRYKKAAAHGVAAKEA